MSASLIAKARARLPEFHDATRLVHQLVGSHTWKLVRLTDSPSDSTQASIPKSNITRHLLVKLKIIFDHQLSFSVLRDSQPEYYYSLVSAGPQRTESRIQSRGDIRAGHVCEVWETHQPLSMVEALVLRRLIPQTIDNIRLHDGKSMIQMFCCGKSDERDYIYGQGPVCIDPSNPHIRLHSLHCCHDLVETSILVVDETGWIDAFWTLYDVNWALMVVTIQSAEIGTTHQLRFARVKAATRQLWERVGTLSKSVGSGTVNSDLCSYFQRVARYLGDDIGFLFPAIPVESVADFQGAANDDVVHFERELARLSGKVKESSPISSPKLPARTLNNIAQDSSPMAVKPDSNLNLAGTHQRPSSPLQSSNYPAQSTGSENAPPRQQARGSDNPGRTGPDLGQATGSTGENIAVNSPSSPRPFSYEPRPEILHLATTRKASIQSSSGSVSEQSFIEPKVPSPSPQPPSLYSPTTTNETFSPTRSDGRGGFSPHSRTWQSGSWSISDQSSTVSSSHQRQRVGSPLSATPSSPFSPQRETLTPPTIIKPSMAVDSGLQVVEEQPQYHHHQPDHNSLHYSSTRTSTPSVSEASSKEPAKKTGLFRLKKLTSFTHHSSSSTSVDKLPSSSTQRQNSIPEDLCFCFSVVGTALLLWRKRQTDHLVKLILPFSNGQKLSLRRFNSSNNIKLVGAGDHLVAVVVSQENKAGYELCCFDKYARRFETQLPDPGGLLPTAIAVSRDDDKMAICCGGTVLIYEMVENVGPKLAGSVPGHSRGSNLAANRRLQQANFSLDSTILVTATQEYHAGDKSPYQVHVRLWRWSSGSPPVLEIELDPVVLDLGYGNDPGLSGVFCSIDHANPMNSRVFLAAQTAKSYDYILMLSRQQKNRRMNLNEKSIGAAAQAMGGPGPGTSPNFGSKHVFKNGRNDLYIVDVRTGVTQPLASFTNERSGMKLDQEANMVVAFPHETLALAFWRSRKGELLLKQVELSLASADRPPTIHTMDLGGVFQKVSLQD
ncbi:hypothetical protein QBC37DRAFT_447781 [Rhypophila decipiens]|uniref:Uncharacterized protein n=1 Tax=Rhypophila decipiens TaxID=261697 RepID=A0AAN6Y1D8_9PEZI|nr:hypothetical protein QBC37DRAFT_447781 [Rhypophila decipiens]